MPFSPRYLKRLSDLEPGDAKLLADAWPKISLRRREALLEDMEESHLADDLMWFEEVARIALNDTQPVIRKRAVQILREYELVDMFPLFIELTEHDPDAEVRAAAAESLSPYVYMGEVDDLSPKKLQKVEECLLRVLSGTDVPLVRRKALEAMGYSSRKEIVDLINQAYVSPDTDWLVSAIAAMGRSANSHWNPHVIKMLDNKRPVVRAEAASAAGELEIKEATTKLLELLTDVDLDVRMAAIWALSQVGGEGVRHTLEQMLETTDDDEEAEQLENALENLEFTEEMKDLTMLEISEDGSEPDGSHDTEDNDTDHLISEDKED